MKRNEVFIPYVISKTPDPLNILYSGDWSVTNHLWSPLIDLKDNGSYVGIIAKSWSRSADGLTWTFTLKPNLKWSDNSPMTINDVVKSLTISKNGTSHTDLSKSIKSISIKNNNIKITLNYFIPEFLTGLTYSDWSIMYHGDVDNNKIKRYSKFSGPYKILSLSGSGLAKSIELIKNENYILADKVIHPKTVISSYSTCEELVSNIHKIATFRMYKDELSKECEQKLKDNNFELTIDQPSWIIKADFTKRALSNLDLEKRKFLIKIIQDDLKINHRLVGNLRATGLRAPFLFGSLSENEFDQIINKIKSTELEGLNISLVVMDIWSKWKSFDFLVSRLRSARVNLSLTILTKDDFFKKFSDGKIHTDYDLIFFPLGVGDVDPDGTWRISSKYLYPGLISSKELFEAFTEKDRLKREAYYKKFSKKLIDEGLYIPMVMNSDIIGVHKDFKIKSGTALRNGTSIFDLTL